MSRPRPRPPRLPFLRCRPPSIIRSVPSAVPLTAYTPEEQDVRGAFRSWLIADLGAGRRDVARLINDVVSPWWRPEARRDATIEFGILVATANRSGPHRAALRALIDDPGCLRVTAEQMRAVDRAFGAVDDGQPEGTEAGGFPRIDALVTWHWWSFQSWGDRDGTVSLERSGGTSDQGKIWAALAPSSYLLDTVRKASGEGGIDMAAAVEYLFSADWLPIVTGPSLAVAMTRLEARLAELPPEMLCAGSVWSNAVFAALDLLRQMENEHPGYGDLELDPRLPQDFTEMGGEP